MTAHTAVLRLVYASICALAILAGPSAGQVGETFRIEAGKPLPHCGEDSAAPLCQVETSLAFKLPQPEPRAAPLIVRMVEWVLGYEEKNDANEGRPGRNSVVAPVIIDYRVEALETLDAADIEALPPGWQESLAPHALESGTVRARISVAYEDAYGMRWPVEGWHSHVYLLREHDDLPVLFTEETSSAREIGPLLASSDCIGSAWTPLCAVETFLACRVRREDALCRDVDDSVGREARWPKHVHYDVSAMDAVDDGSLPPGHRYAVTLDEWDMYRHQGTIDQEIVRYLVERSDQVWRVVGRTIIDRDSPQGPG